MKISTRIMGLVAGVAFAVSAVSFYSLSQMKKINAAKDAFKTMRIVGETKADRSIGARLYAAAIAAGLVHHDQRISRQSDAALRRAFTGLNDDADMPQPLRNLAASALVRLPRATN